jgi:hypothetical protein
LYKILSIIISVILKISPNAKFNPIKDIQLILSLEDPTSFHVFIIISIYGVDRCCGRPPEADAISYKLEAIRFINDRLKRENINNSTIHAVALF